MMEQYKIKLRNRLLFIGAIYSVFIFVAIVALLNEGSDTLHGFMIGLISSSGTILILYGIRYIQAMHNPEKLRKMQIKEEDERNVLIVQKVLSSSFSVFVLIIALATIVFAFVNRDIMFAYAYLLCAAGLVKCCLYWYYKKKL